MLRRIKGQSTLEYAMVITVVVGALLAIRFYMTRSVQGKLRESIDNIGEQYSAGKTTSKYTIDTTASKTKETFGLDPSDTKGETHLQGVSYSTVETPAQVTRTAVGAGAQETITQSFKDETLFPDK